MNLKMLFPALKKAVDETKEAVKKGDYYDEQQGLKTTINIKEAND